MSSENSEIAKRIMELQPPIYGAFSPYSFAAAKHAAATLAAAHESALVRERDEARKEVIRLEGELDKAFAYKMRKNDEHNALTAKLAELEADNKRLREAGNKLAESCGATYTGTFNNSTWKIRACCHTHPNAPHDQSCAVTTWNAAMMTAASATAASSEKGGGE